MSRYFAWVDWPGVDEVQFRAAFGPVRKWRFDRHAWVTKAGCDFARHRVFIECESRAESIFKEWLESGPWRVEEVLELDFIQEGNSVWPMRKSVPARS